MLAVTANAAAAIRSLTDQPTVPDGAGLRIASDPMGGSLSLALVADASEGDQVIDMSGAKLFVDPTAAQLLDDKALDAKVDDTGALQFSVTDQPGTPNPNHA